MIRYLQLKHLMRRCVLTLSLLLLGTASSVAQPPEAAPSTEDGAAPQTRETPPTVPAHLTLDDALRLAEAQHPELTAQRWEIRAAEALVEQAALYPNPELEIELEELRWRDGPDTTTRSTSVSGPLNAPSVAWEREKSPGEGASLNPGEVTISIAQPILLGKKRAKRVALANREMELNLWDYQTLRADILAQTAADFVAVLAAQEQHALDLALVQLAEEVVEVFAQRVDAGQVSPLELSRAEVALANARAIRVESISALNAARSTLASNWQAEEATFEEARGALDTFHPVPSLDTLKAQINQNPDVARWATEVATRRADFTLERAQRISDITLMVGFRSVRQGDGGAQRWGVNSNGALSFSRSRTESSDDREQSLVLGLSLPLPLFDRNQGRIAAAEARIEQSHAEQKVTENAVRAQLAAAQQEAAGAYDKAWMLREEVLPKIEVTHEKMQVGYREGKFSYLEVLDSQQTLFDARKAYLDALTRYHLGIVQLERLTGNTLPEPPPPALPDTTTEDIRHED